MQVLIRTLKNGVVGTVTLGSAGAVLDEGAQNALHGLNIIEPVSCAKLDPSTGERFLRALPANLSGERVWATLEP